MAHTHSKTESDERDFKKKKGITIYVLIAQASQNVPSEQHRGHQDSVTLFMA